MSWGWQKDLGRAQEFGDGRMTWEWQKDLGMAERSGDGRTPGRSSVSPRHSLYLELGGVSHVKSGGFGSAHGHMCVGHCERYLKHFMLC